MKTRFIILLFVLLNNNSFSQKNINERRDLKVLIDERKEKFESYMESLEKKSGIFGNKTKRDILRSNEILTEIVKTDNRIIGTLNLAIDFQNFQKNNLAFDLTKRDAQRDNLLAATDTLSKQVTILKNENKNLVISNSKMKWLLWLLIISNMVFLYLRFKRQ